MSATPETANHSPSDRPGSDLSALPELQQEATAITGECNRAVQRHTTVEHLAGLSEHAIAQELIDHCGPDRVLDAIAQVRKEGKDHFFDLICALLPNLWQRRKFCAQLLSGLPKKQSRQGAQVADDQKEHYLRFCQQCDSLPIAAIPGLRMLLLRDLRKRFDDSEDGSFLAHHHFSSLPQNFDPAQYLEELAASGNQLSRLHKVENEQFALTVARIEQLSSALRRRIHGVIDLIRSEVTTTWAPRIEAIQKDLTQFETTIGPLQSPDVKMIVQATLHSLQRLLKETTAARDGVVKEKSAPYATILHSLPPIPPSAQTPAQSAGEAAGRNGHSNGRNGHSNGKNGHNGKTNGALRSGGAVTAPPEVKR